MALTIPLKQFKCPSCGNSLDKTYPNPARPNGIICGHCKTPVLFIAMGGGSAPGAGGNGGSGGNSIPRSLKWS